jgi:spore maturation protein CgeB
MVSNGSEMTRALRDVLSDRAFAASLASHGRETILSRHTCGHRVDELLAIVDAITGVVVDGAVPA